MPIEKNPSNNSVFIEPENGTDAVLFYYSFLDKFHAKQIKSKIEQSGFYVKLVNVNEIKLVRDKEIKDKLILSFNGTEYRGEKEIDYFYDNHAVLEVYRGIPQAYMERLKEYLSGRGLRIVIDYTEVSAPTLYYKGNIEKITTSILEEAERLNMTKIKRE